MFQVAAKYFQKANRALVGKNSLTNFENKVSLIWAGSIMAVRSNCRFDSDPVHLILYLCIQLTDIIQKIEH